MIEQQTLFTQQKETLMNRYTAALAVVLLAAIFASCTTVPQTVGDNSRSKDIVFDPVDVSVLYLRGISSEQGTLPDHLDHQLVILEGAYAQEVLGITDMNYLKLTEDLWMLSPYQFTGRSGQSVTLRFESAAELLIRFNEDAVGLSVSGVSGPAASRDIYDQTHMKEDSIPLHITYSGLLPLSSQYIDRLYPGYEALLVRFAFPVPE